MTASSCRRDRRALLGHWELGILWVLVIGHWSFDFGLWTSDFSRWTLATPFVIIRLRMKSMTGYGWGECSQNGFKVTLELSSVNRKQSEISINLPRELEVDRKSV